MTGRGSDRPARRPADELPPPELLQDYRAVSRETGQKVLQQGLDRAEMLLKAEEQRRGSAALRSDLFTGLLGASAAVHAGALAWLPAESPWLAACLYAGGMAAWALAARKWGQPRKRE